MDWQIPNMQQNIDPEIRPGRLCVMWKSARAWVLGDIFNLAPNMYLQPGEIFIVLSRHESSGWVILSKYGQLVIYGLSEVIPIEGAKDYGLEV